MGPVAWKTYVQCATMIGQDQYKATIVGLHSEDYVTRDVTLWLNRTNSLNYYFLFFSDSVSDDRRAPPATAAAFLWNYGVFLARDSIYAIARYYAIARPSVRLSVCHTGGSPKDGW